MSFPIQFVALVTATHFEMLLDESWMHLKFAIIDYFRGFS